MKKSKKQKHTFQVRMLDTFWYWINERHRITRAKESMKPWPWTKDPLLQNYKFTNAFRQLDRVTEAWTDRFIKDLCRGDKMKDGDILFHCCMFRLFNLPETYDALVNGMNTLWDQKKAVKILSDRRDGVGMKNGEKQKIFTGAYMVTPGGGDDKIKTYCQVLQDLFDGRSKKEIKNGELPNRHRFAERIRKKPSMERTTNILMNNMECVGAFVAYEIACDLRHTRLLADARDILSWANPGPGAKRGINRLITGNLDWDIKKYGPKPDYVQVMRQLLLMAPSRLEKHVKACEWPFEMREIEHSLCETDKYLRLKRGEGKVKGVYRPKSLQQELPF